MDNKCREPKYEIITTQICGGLYFIDFWINFNRKEGFQFISNINCLNPKITFKKLDANSEPEDFTNPFKITYFNLNRKSYFDQAYIHREPGFCIYDGFWDCRKFHLNLVYLECLASDQWLQLGVHIHVSAPRSFLLSKRKEYLSITFDFKSKKGWARQESSSHHSYLKSNHIDDYGLPVSYASDMCKVLSTSPASLQSYCLASIWKNKINPPADIPELKMYKQLIPFFKMQDKFYEKTYKKNAEPSWHLERLT